jgi:hypothetical protein
MTNFAALETLAVMKNLTQNKFSSEIISVSSEENDRFFSRFKKKWKRTEANGSERKRTEANGSERKRTEANGSEPFCETTSEQTQTMKFNLRLDHYYFDGQYCMSTLSILILSRADDTVTRTSLPNVFGTKYSFFLCFFATFLLSAALDVGRNFFVKFLCFESSGLLTGMKDVSNIAFFEKILSY